MIACACDKLRPRIGEGILFTNLNDQTKEVWMVNAAMATSAAPTFFKHYEFLFNNKMTKFVDGGLAVNNPSLMLLVLAN